MRKKKQDDRASFTPPAGTAPAPFKPTVELLPERYQLNTVLTRFGFAGEPYAPAVLTRVEAEELFEGLANALYPKMVYLG